jgi:hypothetical protein
MIRLTLALAVWIGLVSSAPANLMPRRDRVRPDGDTLRSSAPRFPAEAREPAAGQGASSEYTMTERTEVLLNGKTCRYEAVPASAVIERMEVAPDRKTVLRVFFRTGK